MGLSKQCEQLTSSINVMVDSFPELKGKVDEIEEVRDKVDHGFNLMINTFNTVMDRLDNSDSGMNVAFNNMDIIRCEFHDKFFEVKRNIGDSQDEVRCELHDYMNLVDKRYKHLDENVTEKLGMMTQDVFVLENNLECLVSNKVDRFELDEELSFLESKVDNIQAHRKRPRGPSYNDRCSETVLSENFL